VAVLLGALAILVATFVAGVMVGAAQAAHPPGRDRFPIDTNVPRGSRPGPPDHAGMRPPTSSLATPPPRAGNPDEPATLPGCRLGDRRARPDPWRRWDAIVLDTAAALGRDDVPPDLVDTAQAGLNGGHLLRAIVIPDLRAMARAARADGIGLAILSAYRSYARQASTFGHWVAVAGRREALARSARAGHSEHQLGTTIDFTGARGSLPWRGSDWAMTDAGAWLMDNAWRHGFVLSYPRAQRRLTCYAYEPWHYRYVGRDVASAIHASGMPPRAWLLLNSSR
jgi:D-alanyl-D-alanine carboxypeptidase